MNENVEMEKNKKNPYEGKNEENRKKWVNKSFKIRKKLKKK